MKKFFTKLTSPKKGQKGFTLIELLIVIAILGILAAVAIPNVASFIFSGKLAAANSEVANIQTANQAYAAENDGDFAGSSDDLGAFIDAGADLTGTYTFDTTNGAITAAEGWTGMTFNTDTNKWEKAE